MATLQIYIPYKNLPDAWVEIPCNDGSLEDVIFLDGKRFLDTAPALRYLVEQFRGDTVLAGRYLNSIKQGDCL